MWNSKRLLLLGLGFIVFAAGYTVYASFLGGIDGLPPLPRDLEPSPTGTPISITDLGGRGGDPELDRKCKMAFGQGCKEIERTIKLEMRKKGLIVAADQATPEPDGRFKLTPLSLGIFSEDKGDGKYPEINTIKCDVAYLTFDQPVRDYTEIGQRKIVGAELIGKVTIINNRRTPAIHDDIEIRVFEGPEHNGQGRLFYDEKQNKIWTDGYVRMLDKQTQPHPTAISGKAMELFLSRDDIEPKNAKKSAKPKNDQRHGVERIVLLSTVEMHLYPDANSGFMVGPKTDKGGKPRNGAATQDAGKGNKPPERSHVVIRTPGPFHYDMISDLARFDSPAPGMPNAGDPVHVVRVALEDQPAQGGPLLPFPHCYLIHAIHEALRDRTKDGQQDQLMCDHLELQFRRKNGPANAPRERDTHSTDREIETAHATARPGEVVTLVMDTEGLSAVCADLLYSCPTAARGPQTILRGTPVDAVKDGHKIKAQELLLIGADQKGNGQQLTAKGPGRVDMFDRANPKNNWPVHATWRDLLVSTKDKEGDKLLDLLIFTGEARFLDEDHEQELNGEKLMVWLEPNEQHVAPPPPSGKQDTPSAPRQRPAKVEAFEHVTARSPEMIIHRADHLVIRFEDGVYKLPEQVTTAPPVVARSPDRATLPTAGLPEPRGDLRSGPVARSGDRATTAASKADPPPATMPPPSTSTNPKPATATPAPADDKTNKKPIQLWARDVSAYVTRIGEKNELRELITEGNVHVVQDPAKKEDKGVDITGETLELHHHVSGDILTVYADKKSTTGEHKLAELQLGDLWLTGPVVKIDQQKNIADVKGIGCMRMPSNTTFDGGTPAKPGSMLTVHWTHDMVFNGKDADFAGGVVADQDGGQMKCRTLHVTLDKTVSFKEGQKGGQGAKVERLVSNDKVYILESVFENNKLVKSQRLTGHEVTANNPEGKLIAVGPGRASTLQYGSADSTAPEPSGNGRPAPAKKSKNEEEVLKLTRVDFLERLFSDQPQKNGMRMSIFYGDVHVLHLPADQLDVEVDVDKPPKGAMYMTSELLTVWTKPMPGGKNHQEMRADRNVFFRTFEFFGRADVVKYDQTKDQVIFEGNPTTLYRRKGGRQGPEYETIKGRTILYNRKTGVFILDGGQQINIDSKLDTGPLPGAPSLARAGLHADGQDEAVTGTAVGQECGRDAGAVRSGQRAECPYDNGRRDVLAGVVARHDG
ncbi:MAG TPA: hypothetical protein VEL76_31890 [Gemmataceae bacterium]|nr:hypothetical protein [Gemmataceae bacterium]